LLSRPMLMGPVPVICLPDFKTGDHANRGGERHGDKEANEAERIAKSRNCEHHLHGIEMDALPNEERGEHIVCNTLAHGEDS
jgi:hypothetical protein